MCSHAWYSWNVGFRGQLAEVSSLLCACQGSSLGQQVFQQVLYQLRPLAGQWFLQFKNICIVYILSLCLECSCKDHLCSEVFTLLVFLLTVQKRFMFMDSHLSVLGLPPCWRSPSQMLVVFLFKFCEECYWNFDENRTESADFFVNIAISMILGILCGAVQLAVASLNKL